MAARSFLASPYAPFSCQKNKTKLLVFEVISRRGSNATLQQASQAIPKRNGAALTKTPIVKILLRQVFAPPLTNHWALI